jgi:predicted anti-sigma-YlaC factor YlaD
VTCEELRSVAAELALDELTGTERSAALSHLSSCDSCRALVADLAVAADTVLLLTPSVEPPPGFESRVIDRIGQTSAPSSRWRRVAAAAVIAAVVGSGIGFAVGQVGSGGDAEDFPVAAVLTSARGTAAGSVVLATGPDRMTCVFEDDRFGGAYEVRVLLDDGTSVDVGGFTADGAPWSWTVPLPVDASDVR